MDGWLKDDFPPGEKAEKAEKAERLAVRQIAQRVTARAARRRSLQRAIGSSSVLALVVCAAVGMYFFDGRWQTADGNDIARSVPASAVGRPSLPPSELQRATNWPSAVGRPPSAVLPHPSPTLPVTLEKVDHSVSVAWEGSRDSEYIIYRCNSPKFDTCSLADLVKGTQWVDSGAETGTIIFYRVEKKA